MIFKQPGSYCDFDHAHNARWLWIVIPQFIVLGIACSCFGVPAYAADYQAAISRLEAAIGAELESKSLPAFSIALVDGQKTVWSAGYGYQDTEKQIPATSETIYRVGSISKLFTDIAVMQMVEQGRLDLDAPVQKYLPSFRPTDSPDTQLTLRQMMMHRSGLVRESPVGNYFDPTEPSLAQTVASLNRTELVYRPETKTKYSNAAIAVVGAVLESQLDQSHPQQVRTSILDPLGMNHSSFTSAAVPREHLAVGWMRTHDGRRPFVAPDFLLGTGPAGNLYSSVDDLAKFLACLHDDCRTPTGQILDAQDVSRHDYPNGPWPCYQIRLGFPCF